MSRRSLAVVGLMALVAAPLASSLGARAQNAPRLEYARVVPVVTRVYTSPNSVQERRGYRACVAGAADWTCRDFPATEIAGSALRTTLSTLGNEGWELVSAVNENP